MVQKMMLFDFRKKTSQTEWGSVNDVVMGGLSDSGFEILEDGFAIFSGIVSLEHGGGFASVKTKPRNFNLSSFRGVRLKLRGDGKRYSFRIRDTDDVNRPAYEMSFDTKENMWQELDLPFEDFKAVFRGRVIEDAGPLHAAGIVQFGFMIKDRQPGPFKLNVERIEAL